ncbi:MAG TPA: DUF1559 domain-containing protein, partial [Pirellulaceae bacterium]|nr:DUF1559 domain-containing protein [Pirellulaceae bacterium]
DKVIETGFQQSFDWVEPSSPIFYARAQHISSLALILPMLDREEDYRSLPVSATAIGSLYDVFHGGSPPYVWIGDNPDVARLARTAIPMFFCPSDELDRGLDLDIRPMITTQPAYFTDNESPFGPGDVFLWNFVESDGTFQGTNYVGCSGAHSGGVQPLPEFRPFAGVMSCRRPITMAKIKDGTNNTIMYGETLGYIFSQKRTAVQVWCFGGLARGRGVWRWMHGSSDDFPEYYLFGDSWFSGHPGFGSAHPANVNVAMAGGTVHSISRTIDWRVFYSLCRAFDGEIVTDW